MTVEVPADLYEPGLEALAIGFRHDPAATCPFAPVPA